MAARAEAARERFEILTVRHLLERLDAAVAARGIAEDHAPVG